MQPRISILTIGSELLDGRVVDTNAQFLCAQLCERGFSVSTTASCDDEVTTIVRTIEFLLTESEGIVISGGLGPTSDDLTREAIGELCSVPLELHADSLAHIKSIFAKRGRTFEPSNQKQAMLPKGAAVIQNSVGTAPGFWIECALASSETPPRILISLPGVPRELHEMFERSVASLLETRFSARAPQPTAAFKLFGLPESVVGARITALSLPPSIKVSYRAKFPEIHVVLRSCDPSVDLAAAYRTTLDAVGSEYVFSQSLEEGFEEKIYWMLRERGCTLGLAESCTGGMIASIVTAAPGSSEYFLGAVVSYSNQIKSSILGVAPALIDTHGAVSAEVARAMARGARTVLRSDIALSVTGIAGPGGGTAEKPVGTFFVGISDEGGDDAFRYFLPSRRDYVRRYAAYVALDLLRRRLFNYSPLTPYEPQASTASS